MVSAQAVNHQNGWSARLDVRWFLDSPKLNPRAIFGFELKAPGVAQRSFEASRPVPLVSPKAKSQRKQEDGEKQRDNDSGAVLQAPTFAVNRVW